MSEPIRGRVTLPSTTGGFPGEATWEIEQNSKGTNVRILGKIAWENWSAYVPADGKDDEFDFMVGLGDGEGGSGKCQPLRVVIARLTAEARAGIADDLAALDGGGA